MSPSSSGKADPLTRSGLGPPNWSVASLLGRDPASRVPRQRSPHLLRASGRACVCSGTLQTPLAGCEQSVVRGREDSCAHRRPGGASRGGHRRGRGRGPGRALGGGSSAAPPARQGSRSDPRVRRRQTTATSPRNAAGRSRGGRASERRVSRWRPWRRPPRRGGAEFAVSLPDAAPGREVPPLPPAVDTPVPRLPGGSGAAARGAEPPDVCGSPAASAPSPVRALGRDTAGLVRVFRRATRAAVPGRSRPWGVPRARRGGCGRLPGSHARAPSASRRPAGGCAGPRAASRAGEAERKSPMRGNQRRAEGPGACPRLCSATSGLPTAPPEPHLFTAARGRRRRIAGARAAPDRSLAPEPRGGRAGSGAPRVFTDCGL